MTEEILQAAQRAVAALAPLTEAEAWERAQDDPWTLLSPEQRDVLDELDTLDFLATGQSRGCHYGACRSEPYGTSWRS